MRQDALPANLVSGGILRSQTTIPAFGRRSFLRRVHSSQRHPHGSSVFCGDRQPLTGIEAKLKRILCRLHLRPLRNDAILDVTPQGDEQLTGQRHDHDFLEFCLRFARHERGTNWTRRCQVASATTSKRVSTIAARNRRFPSFPIPCSRSLPPLENGVPPSPT